MNNFAEKRKEWVFKQRNKLLRMIVPGQDKFRNLLDAAHILYVREQPSFRCYSSDVCFMDFYVPYYQLDIEIDGRQHRYEDRYEKDISKADFLWKDRIATIHISNKEVWSLDKIDIKQLWEDRVTEEQRNEIERVKRNQMEGWRLFYSRHHIGLDLPVWLFFKENRRTYRFDNILDLQRSIHYDEEKVFGVLEKERKSNFFVSFDKKELSDMVDEWRKR